MRYLTHPEAATEAPLAFPNFKSFLLTSRRLLLPKTSLGLSHPYSRHLTTSASLNDLSHSTYRDTPSIFTTPILTSPTTSSTQSHARAFATSLASTLRNDLKPPPTTIPSNISKDQSTRAHIDTQSIVDYIPSTATGRQARRCFA